MSVPIAVVGWIPKIRISSGVISEPPPIPVIPTMMPSPNPKRSIAGAMVSCDALAARGYLSTFLTSLVRSAECARIPRMSVSIRGLGHSYAELRTIERLDLEVGEHEVVGLVGPSGCGKSTLLELICGLLDPGSGTIAVGGAETAAGRLSQCAYMPQSDQLLPWYSALDNAALALRNRAHRKAEARERAVELFGRFGLGDFESP